jgi:hypothetical protein
MKQLMFYAAGRAFTSLGECAAEVSRISGEDAELWRLRKILDGNKGFINGVTVFQKIVETEEEDPHEEETAAEEPRKRKRSPLMRPPVWGLPPKWR